MNNFAARGCGRNYLPTQLIQLVIKNALSRDRTILLLKVRQIKKLETFDGRIKYILFYYSGVTNFERHNKIFTILKHRVLTQNYL